MKPQTIVSNGIIPALAFLFFLLTTVASSAQTTGRESQQKSEKPKDFDEVLQQLHKAEAELQRAMKDVDWKSIEQEIKASMQQAKTDIAKAQAEMQKELKALNTEKIKADLDKALQEAKSIDMTKMQQELTAALAKIDTEKIKAELDKIKEIDLDKIKAELEKVKPEIEESMRKAKEDIEKAKEEIKEYKTFVNTLEQDGLINQKEGYSIEIKEESLIINGKQQGQDVYNKHRAFLQKHKGTTIKKSDTDFNILKD